MCFACEGGNVQEEFGRVCSTMDILISGLDIFVRFEIKGNLTDSTASNIGESGDIHTHTHITSHGIIESS